MKSHTISFPVPVGGAEFSAALEGLTRVNEGLMREGQPIPALYQAGVRYRDEPRDVWRNAAIVAGEKWGDCEDLSAYRAAELRVSGEDPGANVGVYKSGPHRYHAVVNRGDGTIEDPSRVLGMGAPKMPNVSRRGVNVIGADPLPDDGRSVSFEVVPIGGGWGKPKGWRGFVRIPLGFSAPSATIPGAPMVPQALTALGPVASTPQAAQAAAAKQASSAMSKVSSVLQNPLVQAGLSQIPGGALAASIIANPTAQKIATAAVKKLKFW